MKMSRSDERALLYRRVLLRVKWTTCRARGDVSPWDVLGSDNGRIESGASNDLRPSFRINCLDNLIDDQTCGCCPNEQSGVVRNKHYRGAIFGKLLNAFSKRVPHHRIQALLRLIENQQR